MKIIFLDIDGVLVTQDCICQPGWPHKPDPRCVAALNRLLELSGALIVVSSSWRVGRTRIELCDLLNDWGIIPGHILDRTGHTNFEDKRGDEIRAWLDQRERRRGDVEKFIILDYGESFLGRSVK